jgi:membrane protease YdiL (CAAX protease family)
LEVAEAIPHGNSPYQTPEIQDLQSPLPLGKVSTNYYQPIDLLGIGFIYTIFFSLVIGTIRASGKTEHVLSVDSIIQSIVFQFIMAGIVTAFVISRVRPVEWLGLKWSGWRWVILIAPGTVIGMLLFFSGLQLSGFMQWIESFGIETVQDSVKILKTSNDPVILGLMMIAAVIIAPICEEIVFRGYFYSASKKFAGPWAACICSALIFGAAHGNFAALLPLFVFGAVLTWVYEKTGSLWAPIAVHCSFNGTTVLIQMIARYYKLPLDGLS